MGLAEKLKNLTKKAEDTAAEHTDQLHQAVQKAETAADQRTGGKYHDKIAEAGDKADAYLDTLNPPQTQPEPPGADTTKQPEPRSGP
jgi:ABC-type transporter Mla subunit MlaD